jgi:type I restriction enzyme, S subunit
MLDRTSKLKAYRFDQMAVQINDWVDNPAESGVERYVGLEHLDVDFLRIRRWGDITDVESTKLRF